MSRTAPEKNEPWNVGYFKPRGGCIGPQDGRTESTHFHLNYHFPRWTAGEGLGRVFENLDQRSGIATAAKRLQEQAEREALDAFMQRMGRPLKENRYEVAGYKKARRENSFGIYRLVPIDRWDAGDLAATLTNFGYRVGKLKGRYPAQRAVLVGYNRAML